MITTDKQGDAKDFHDFMKWARGVQAIREEVIQDNGTGTEQAFHVPVLSKDEVQQCYRRIGRQMLENELLPHQQWDDQYELKFTKEGRMQLSNFQRSFIDSMLRRRLGDKKVAFHIWENGLPMLFDRSILQQRAATEHSVTLEMLQSTLDDALQWYAALAKGIVQYEAQPELQVRRELGAKESSKQQHIRRQALRAANQAWRQAKKLVEQRDSKKRTWESMSVLKP